MRGSMRRRRPPPDLSFPFLCAFSLGSLSSSRRMTGSRVRGRRAGHGTRLSLLPVRGRRVWSVVAHGHSPPRCPPRHLRRPPWRCSSWRLPLPPLPPPPTPMPAPPRPGGECSESAALRWQLLSAAQQLGGQVSHSCRAHRCPPSPVPARLLPPRPPTAAAPPQEPAAGQEACQPG